MINRVANFLGNSHNPPQHDSRGFTVNPFAPSTPAWQMQLYQAAFMQAQKDIEKENENWPFAEWWN